MSIRTWPGNAPHGVIPRPYPIADQWFSETVPYCRSANARSTAGRVEGSFAVRGSTMSVALSVPHTVSFAKRTARSRKAAVSEASMGVSAVTLQNASTR